MYKEKKIYTNYPKEFNRNKISVEFIADDVATMKEKLDDGTYIVRRWIKINVNELNKSLFLDEKWLDVNPRKQNINLKPSKSMKLTLTGDKRDIFHLLNRGISISAYECSVKTIKDKKKVTIVFNNNEEHGIFDGGHTYKVLLETFKKANIIGVKHVILEVLTGVEEFITDLARSRNTSSQVKEKSLANLSGKFDFIKDALRNQCFFNNIAWMENDDGDISISYIIQILTAFNKNLSNKSMPKTYSGSGACETSYIREFDSNIDNKQLNNVYYKLTPLYKDIFRFVDHVLVQLPTIYNDNGYYAESGRFGSLRGITYKQDFFPLMFTPGNHTSSYKIPNALFFPILGAMRQLYQEGPDGFFEWIIDPITVFDDLGPKLVQKVMGYYFDKQGIVNDMGKSLGLWADTFEIVRAYLEAYKQKSTIEKQAKEIEELRKKLGDRNL